MAEYKVSELNSIDTVRSDDLLHLRVIKRSDMLGDEDRKMTYANFLASFKLERFLQLVGGTMTGNLGIVKLTYGGKDLLDPTGASEVIIGDVAKTFKVNSNGLRLVVADATRTANVYHTLNKPTPNELGMRTNAENDARYSQLATENTFLARQIININGVGLTLKSIYPDAGAFIEARDSTNALRFTLGNLTSSSDVTLVNSKGAKLTLGTTTVSVDKTLTVNGQVQPNDWVNFDARFFTQTAADQRFAKLNGDNTLTGVNRFIGKTYVTDTGNVLNLRAASANAALFLQAYASTGTESWYLGQPDGTKSDINLFNQMTGAALRLSTEFFMSKALNVTGQVKPSDFSNFDARYVPSSLTNVLARTNAANTFNGVQTIVADSAPLILKNTQPMVGNWIDAKDSTGAGRWYIGNFDSSDVIRFHNYKHGTYLELRDVAQINKDLAVIGQILPSNFTNFDSRYYTKANSEARYTRIIKLDATTGTSGYVKIATVRLLQSANTAVLRLYGGEGFNVGSTAQCGANTIVLRSGNSSPVGINARLYRNTESSFGRSICTVATGNDYYDVYVTSGEYAMGILVEYQTTGDSIVVPSTGIVLATKPEGAVDGVVVTEYNSLQKPSASDVGAYTRAETDQKIAAAITNSTDLSKIYPVGIVTFFASNVNPNTAFAGTTWTYLTNGNQRTIRVAQPDGSDVGAVGGSDSRSIAVGNLPSHTHSFSGTVSTHNHGNIATWTAGNHSHSCSGSTAAAGAHNHTAFALGWQMGWGYPGGNQNMGEYAKPTSTNGEHAHTFSGTTNATGDHAHTVPVGAHAHTFSGNTGGTGSGAAFDVTNSFIKLMTWVRTA